MYRMTYTKKPLQKPVKIDGQPIAKLLNNLKHKVDGVRHPTRIELSERNSEQVIAPPRNGSSNSTRKARPTPTTSWKHCGSTNNTTSGTSNSSTCS